MPTNKDQFLAEIAAAGAPRESYPNPNPKKLYPIPSGYATVVRQSRWPYAVEVYNGESGEDVAGFPDIDPEILAKYLAEIQRGGHGIRIREDPNGRQFLVHVAAVPGRVRVGVYPAWDVWGPYDHG